MLFIPLGIVAFGVYTVSSKTYPVFNHKWHVKKNDGSGCPDFIMQWIVEKLIETGLPRAPGDLIWNYGIVQ